MKFRNIFIIWLILLILGIALGVGVYVSFATDTGGSTLLEIIRAIPGPVGLAVIVGWVLYFGAPIWIAWLVILFLVRRVTRKKEVQKSNN